MKSLSRCVAVAATVCLAAPAVAGAKPDLPVDPGSDPVGSAQCAATTGVGIAGRVADGSYQPPRLMGPFTPATVCGVTVG